MKVFLHPSVLKERENELIIKEQNIQVRKFMLEDRERILKYREKTVTKISISLFLLGFAMGCLAILALGL
jgi:hypothetical protein